MQIVHIYLYAYYDSLKATKDVLVKSAAKTLAETFTVPIGLPDFENFISLEKIKEASERFYYYHTLIY